MSSLGLKSRYEYDVISSRDGRGAFLVGSTPGGGGRHDGAAGGRQLPLVTDPLKPARLLIFNRSNSCRGHGFQQRLRIVFWKVQRS